MSSLEKVEKKITQRTPDVNKVYIDIEEEYDVSQPNSYTTVIDFEGDYEWLDNDNLSGGWSRVTNPRITVYCNCISLTGSCTGREVESHVYECNKIGCSTCELTTIVECEANPTGENVPNGVSIRNIP